MAKAGKLTKLKSVLKKLNSFGSKCHHSSVVATASSDTEDNTNLHPVYVGKSKRRYLVTSNVICNPVFRQLVVDDSDSVVSVGCEVVMFEHLLWMLEHADQHDDGHHELVQYYTTC